MYSEQNTPPPQYSKPDPAMLMPISSTCQSQSDRAHHGGVHQRSDPTSMRYWTVDLRFGVIRAALDHPSCSRLSKLSVYREHKTRDVAFDDAPA